MVTYEGTLYLGRGLVSYREIDEQWYIWWLGALTNQPKHSTTHMSYILRGGDFGFKAVSYSGCCQEARDKTAWGRCI